VRILIITRHYPPEMAGGSRRPSGLAKGLRALGHEVFVVAPTGAEDSHLLAVSHPVFPVLADGGSGERPVSLSDWMRRWILLPDPEIRWALSCVRAVSQAAVKPDWIITTSPPESLHVAGALLKKKLKARWLADVRDLWLTNPQRPERLSPLRRACESLVARWLMQQADAVVGVSPIVLEESVTFSANAKSKRSTTNHAVIGHFASPYEGPPHSILTDETFNIVHTGSVQLSNPLSRIDELLAAFEAFQVQKPEARLWLAGRLSGIEVAKVHSSASTSKIRLLGSLPMEEARALQKGADALALVSGPSSHALPGKISEYETTGLPILIAGDGPWRDLLQSRQAIPFDKGYGLTKRSGSLPVVENGDIIAARQFLKLMETADLPFGDG
jgi:glycosyltransferase involved in cell wall biosynthesis